MVEDRRLVTPESYGRQLALAEPPVSDAVIESAARILASVEAEDVAA